MDLPHRYRVAASAEDLGSVTLSSAGIPSLETDAPAQFGGPGDLWSPETLLVGAVADCFVLSFRAIARNSKLAWQHLDCSVEGVLDRAEGAVRFTGLTVQARLVLPPQGDIERGRRLLEKAEKACLITNSLIAKAELQAEVQLASS
jgi:peroxiredoxin-like protein